MINRFLKFLISCIYFTANQIIVQMLPLLKERRSETFVALTYHGVKLEQRSKFKRQMDELVRSGHAVSADVSHILKNEPFHIAVTFDDGFQNILENALPAMRERNIPASIFVTTGYMGEKPGWITDPRHPNADELLMTDDHLKDLPADHVTIGSHTVSHPHLANVDMRTTKKELTDSKKKLEDLLHRKVTLLSLPYGSIDKKNIEWFKQAGYDRVFLNIPTFPATLTGRYFVGRIDTSPDDWMIEYKLKLKGAYQWLPWAIAAKRKMKRLVQGPS
jgi:peptidoglycan/xylan/chitin deacetylase (PgdA/CDA1 family)